MEPLIIEAKKLPPADEEKDPTATTAHQAAVEFVEKNRDFFEQYAGHGVKFVPAAAGDKTFSFNLQTNEIAIHPLFYEKLGFSDEKTTFATCHEVEHFLEKAQLLKEPDGPASFARYLEELKESQAFGVLDNCVADVRENRAVVAKTKAAFGALEQTIYQENLFPETDFTAEPKHIQFAYALLREARLPSELCTVAPEVRAQLDKVKAIKNKNDKALLEIMTNPDLPMSMRLRLQKHFLVPLMEELLKQDIKEQKKQKGQAGQVGDSADQNADARTGVEADPDPNSVFADAYERAKTKVPSAVPIAQIKKAFDEWRRQQEDPLAKANSEYARKIGVDPEALEQYRDIVSELEKTKNPETNENIIEELRQLFARIIARRIKPAVTPRYPVEEGEELVDPASALAEVRSGNLEPKVWETVEIKDRSGPLFGEVEITLVCDRSSSMSQAGKLAEQRKVAVLTMEALKEFSDQCDAEAVNLIRPLEVRSEIYAFQATSQDELPLKVMSKELGEKERIDIAATLASAPGNATTDFITLEAISEGLDEDDQRKIKAGELKKIVIVFTDGESSDAAKLKKVLQTLRKKGVVAVGVGITVAGQAAVENYAPDGRLAEQAEMLAKVLADLLREQLVNL